MMKTQKYILIVLTFFACVVPVIAQEKKPAQNASVGAVQQRDLSQQDDRS